MKQRFKITIDPYTPRVISLRLIVIQKGTNADASAREGHPFSLHQAQEIASSSVDCRQVCEVQSEVSSRGTPFRTFPQRLKQWNPGSNQPAMEFERGCRLRLRTFDSEHRILGILASLRRRTRLRRVHRARQSALLGEA